MGSQRVRQDWSNLACIVQLWEYLHCFLLCFLFSKSNLKRLSIHISKRYWLKWKHEKESETASHSVVSICHPRDHSLSCFSVHGISQTRIIEEVPISSSRRSSWPRDWTHISCIFKQLFSTELPGKPTKKNLADYKTLQRSGPLRDHSSLFLLF